MEMSAWQWIVTALSLSSAYVFLYFRSKHRFWELQKIAGPDPLPLVGNILRERRIGWHEQDLRNVHKYGTVHGIFHAATPVLVIADTDLLREVLVRDFATFPIRRTSFHPIQKQDLAHTNGVRWKQQRSILSTTFTPAKMKAMHGLMKESIALLLQYIDDSMRSGVSVEMDGKRLFGDLTLGVIAKCAFATNVNPHQEGGESELLQQFKNFFHFNPLKLMMIAILPDRIKSLLQLSSSPKSTVDYLTHVARSILQQRKQQSQDGGSDHVDLLHSMIQLGEEAGQENGLTEEEIMANILLVLVGGYDTTASLLTYTTYALALNPDVQKKLRAEIDAALDQDNGEIRYDHVMSLPYLEAVVKESLRHYPPAISVERRAVSDYRSERGFFLRKGDKIQIPIYAIHHLEQYFPDPFIFDPERFMPPRVENVVPYSFLAFHAGPRNCIGARFALLEAKTALVALLAKFEVQPCDRTAVPLDFARSMITLHADSVIVAFVRRQNISASALVK